MRDVQKMKYDSNNLSSNDVTLENAKRFVERIYKMRCSHFRDCVSLSEKYGLIDDYSEYQERYDLENYKIYVDSFEFDELKKVLQKNEEDDGKVLMKLRKHSSYYDDV